MKLRHAIIVGGAMSGMVVIGATPALAAYQPTTGTGTVNKSKVKVGQSVRFCGGGFAPGATIRIRVGGDFYEMTQANGNGRFCASVRLREVGPVTLAGIGPTGGDGRLRVVAGVVVRPKHGDRDDRGDGGRDDDGGRDHEGDRDRGGESVTGGGGGEDETEMSLAGATIGGGATPLTAGETAALASGSLLLLGASTGFGVARRRRQPVS